MKWQVVFARQAVEHASKLSAAGHRENAQAVLNVLA